MIEYHHSFLHSFFYFRLLVSYMSFDAIVEPAVVLSQIHITGIWEK